MFTNCHTHSSVRADFEILQGVIDSTPSTFHSIGIHPWESGECAVDELIERVSRSVNDKTLAIGECGLDGLKGPGFMTQIPVFEKQIELSETIALPLIIHCVKSWNELLLIRKKHRPRQPWIFHGFAKAGIINQVVQSGMMVSLGAGILYHPKREEIVKAIPDERLLLETDDVQVEIKQVYESVAELKQISLQQLNELITTNFKQTFTKWRIG